MKITTKIAREFLRSRLDDLYYAPNGDLPVPVHPDLFSVDWLRIEKNIYHNDMRGDAIIAVLIKDCPVFVGINDVTCLKTAVADFLNNSNMLDFYKNCYERYATGMGEIKNWKSL